MYKYNNSTRQIYKGFNGIQQLQTSYCFCREHTSVIQKTTTETETVQEEHLQHEQHDAKQ